MIAPKDLIILNWSSKRKGAWDLTVENGVHIIHLPTGIEIKEDSCRSQHQNKNMAIAKLKVLLLKRKVND